MNITLSCPSKTFLIGEYSALIAGPTIVVNTRPRFCLHVISKDAEQHSINRGVKKHSPAGKFLHSYRKTFQQLNYEFRDPHTGHGGFGASSAQFLLFYGLKKWLQNPRRFNTKNIDPNRLINDYIACAWDGSGLAPSGTDLLSQLYGNIVFYHRADQTLQRYHWTFQDIDFLLMRTGNKIPTHQHLKTLHDFNSDNLQRLVLQAKLAFDKTDKNLLISSINDYADELQSLNLVSESTNELLATIKMQTPILAAKGCGALGADVILIIFARENFVIFDEWAQKNNLKIVATSANISSGVYIQRKKIYTQKIDTKQK